MNMLLHNLKVALRMLDWQFTEEGTIAGQYGRLPSEW